MVLASHVIFSAYGFWLPNDPRGSWSDFVRSWELFLHGNPTKVNVRHSVASAPHDRAARQRAKTALQYNPVHFTGRQALTISRGFAKAIAESTYVVHACSILPRHTHMVIARHERDVEKIIGHLKTRATQQLVEEDLHPFVRFRDDKGRFPSVWAHRAWKVFLNSPDDIIRSIQYVKSNPSKEGKKPQTWSFITEYPQV